MSIISRATGKTLTLLMSLVLLSACGGNKRFETIEFKHKIDPRHIAIADNRPQFDPQFDLSQWFGNIPLDGHIPILMVERRIDEIVVESTDVNVDITWSLPERSESLFLRLSDNNFDSDSCPVSGTPGDFGIEQLATIDNFSHPLRLVYEPANPWATLNITAPQLNTGGRYYVQGCTIARETGQFTGAATNTVVVEVASALPDLVVREIRTLGRSADALGRLLITVADLNAGRERDIRSGSFNYQVIIFGQSGEQILTYNGIANMFPGGGAWIVPGSETPDLSDDPRIPDDGLEYRIRVAVNNDDTGILFPEASHRNNTYGEELIARPKPLIFGIDQVRVTENCDQISDGDWLMMLGLEFQGRDHRLLAESTIDVPDNSIADPKMAFMLMGTNQNSSVNVRLGFIDCDMDAVSGFLLPFYGPGFSIAYSTLSCGGEEAFEVGGANDLVGWASASLGGVTTESMSIRSATATEENCGPAPFSVDFKLMTSEQATNDGYDLSRAIRIR